MDATQAATAAWLSTGKKFHAMHEAPHDPSEILGGMWGARGNSRTPPLPGVYDAMRQFVAEASSEKYGDDMAFLKKHVLPKCDATNVCHHSASTRPGTLVPGLASTPFPETP